MKQYDFTVTGGAAMVQVLKFARMPHVGQTETVLNTNAGEYFYGGCGYNVWKALCQLGSRAYPVLAHEHPLCGTRLAEDCARYQLPTDGIFGPPKACYYNCLMMSDAENEHITISYWSGEDAVVGGISAHPELQDAFFADSRMVVMVVGTPDTGYEIINMVKKHHLPLLYSYRNDPLLVPEDMLRTILQETTVLFTNEVEAEYIRGLYGFDAITDLFRATNIQVIVTTLGKNGSRITARGPNGKLDSFVVPITQAPAGSVDAVGAGDAFVAGFAYGLSQGKSLRTCAQYGSTVSSFAIEKDGSSTNLPTCEEMLARNRTRPDACDD